MSHHRPQNLRRLRQNARIRELVSETSIDPRKLIQPLFVVAGLRTPEPIPGLTGVKRDHPESLLKQVEVDLEAGVTKFLLFGVPSEKTESEPSPDFTAAQIRALKKRFGNSIWLGVDVCLCSHTTHGHCGILSPEKTHIDNGKSVAELARFAAAYADAGADCVAPSDMMDGRIAAIRETLDQIGDDRTLILSYSAKFHSKFYGPFRVAADSSPKHNPSPDLQNRATYQIDPGNFRDAYRSSVRDWKEGADLLMVKPGLPYLDVLYRLSKKIPLPFAVYEVSGEFAAIEMLAKEGLVDGPQAHLESWTAFFRAGASMIITYGARSARLWLQKA